MSICYSALDSNIQATSILIQVTKDHPLIQLGQALKWQELANLVQADLEKTAKGQ